MALAPNTIVPVVDTAAQTMAFPYAAAINLQETFISRLNPVQEQYKVYSHLNLSNTQEYTITKFGMDALVLQSGEGCDLTEGSAISTSETTVKGVKVAMFEGLCSATLLSEANQTQVLYDAGKADESRLTALYEKILTTAANTATTSLLATNVAGNLYLVPDGSNGYVYASGVTSAQQAAYVRQVGVDVDGWIKLAIDNGNSNGSISDANGKFGSANNTTTTYAAGKAALMKEALLALASPELRAAFIDGAYNTTDGRTLTPVIIVDSITMAAISKDYNLQAAGAALNANSTLGGGRYTRLQQPDGRGYFYFLDGILIYNEKSQQAYEKYLTGYQAFMALTLTETICFGNSFQAFPTFADGENYPTAVEFKAKSSLGQKGAYEMRADFLVHTSIADNRYMAIASAYIHP